MTTPALFWNPLSGRELDATMADGDTISAPIVACLNVWNDLMALRRTLPTWIQYVDRVVAVDGAYAGTDMGLSTDGTREFLQEFPKIELIDAAGLTQCEKRTRYLQEGRAGEFLFIVDADETVFNAQMLEEIPVCDVGWVRVKNDLYAREYGQPRLIRWRPGLSYQRRHHWMYLNDELLCTHQYAGPNFAHRPMFVGLYNQRTLNRSRDHMTLKRSHATRQVATERIECAMPRSTMSDTQIGGREALQILNFAYRDDGLAPSRLHTAINRTTPHSSLFFKSRPGPFDVPEQYFEKQHAQKLVQALQTADILHFHGVMSKTARAPHITPIVFHHHGSLLRANAAAYNTQAKQRNALVLVSNLELLSWTGDLDAKFLPNTIPASRYAALADQVRTPYDGTTPFRVAHSPTKRERKGTIEFLSACNRLLDRGVPIEPVLICDMSHADALTLKATCHASFDSFWLGMQCSGIEAAAMGMPVIAGDATVAARYREHFGAVPYTFAENEEQLEHELFRIIDSTEYRAAEQTRVHDYIIANHDEAAVALTYLDYLDQAFHWRTQRPSTLTNRSRSRFPGARV